MCAAGWIRLVVVYLIFRLSMYGNFSTRQYFLNTRNFSSYSQTFNFTKNLHNTRRAKPDMQYIVILESNSTSNKTSILRHHRVKRHSLGGCPEAIFTQTTRNVRDEKVSTTSIIPLYLGARCWWSQSLANFSLSRLKTKHTKKNLSRIASCTV